uniref:Integrase zinc-binding domain-containing protein n=1 Tax=Calidris pygmaea TaxID=425635 RepID=A0A8C3JLR7_9CHAR
MTCSLVAKQKPFLVAWQWEHLQEWLHVKHGHSGRKDMYKEAISRGWAVTRELHNTVVSTCRQCQTHLEKHNPLKDQPLHLRTNKGLWQMWQIDYIGPF